MKTHAFEHPGALPVLTGPTAVGKTSLALELAERFDAEIISADSRQIYRELTLGTAKPETHELSRVPHHFIDELDLGTPYSAGRFARDATLRIRRILERGRTPLIVGGSTLYLHALQYGLADVPEVAPAVRRRMEARLAKEGAAALYAELHRLDPAAAATLDATKTQRLVRALEVYHGTGRPLSDYQAERRRLHFRFQVVVLHRDRAELYRRIERRVDRMLERGLLDEVRGLLERGFPPSLQALRTIGYRETIACLHGETDEDEMVRLMKRNSRRYAKRQLTWFRRYPSYRWVDADEDVEVIRRFLELQ